MRVLVVGGGITGLAAAWEALTLGHEVTLCEASPRFGGKLWTESIDGWAIDHGPDSFVSYRPEVRALAAEIGAADRIIGLSGARRVMLRGRGRLREMPRGMGMVLPTRIWPFLTTGVLSVPDKLRAGADLLLPRQLTSEDISIGDFLRRRLGDGVVDRFAEPLVGGIYGSSVDQLSLDAVLPSLRAQEAEHRSLVLAGIAGRKPAGSPGSPSPFSSFSGGMATLIEALVSALAAGGAALHPATAVDSLADHDADAVVLAGGVRSSAELLRASDPEASAVLDQIPLTSSTVVTLGFSASALAEPLRHQGWLESGAAPISGVTVSSGKWPDRAGSGRVLLRAFVPARLGAVADLPDDQLVDAVIEHLRPDLSLRGDPELVRVSRWRELMPCYTVGHLDKVAAVANLLAGSHRVRVAGSALRGVGIPDCIADGRRQVQALVNNS